ncbi:hypothetical protein R1sor_008623 [Riccia sorocarpa]|uniref:DUF8039 domain-containing protein n=1 Tax=Riccia sorocarpa TaxID=122646 RepID=A0ABD3HWR9_9MARC
MIAMEVGVQVELETRGVLVAVGTVFSVTPSALCHFTRVGEDRVIVQVDRSIIPESPLPYPNDGANNVGEAVQGFILWDKKHCKVLRENGSGAMRRKDKATNSACTPPQALEIDPDCMDGSSDEGTDSDEREVDIGGQEVPVELLMYKNREENAGIVITTLIPNTDPSFVQAQLPNYTADEPHLCSWPIRLLKPEENGWILGDLYSAYDDADFGRESAQVTTGHQKRHYHSTKKKLLSTEEKTLKKMQKKGTAKLTDESIRQAIAKGCSCTQKCWKNWSIEEIREERGDIFGVQHDMKLDLLFAKIDASKQRKDGMVLFKDGRFVCQRAFYNFHGIARSTFYSYKSGSEARAKQGFHGNTGTLKPRDKTPCLLCNEDFVGGDE